MDQLIENLRAVVGRENVLAGRDELIVYECDGLTQHRHTPRAVAFPASTEEVAGVVAELARAGVSFAPRGAGTGLSGGALAVGGGVVVELARMRKLLRLDVENRVAVVETGMINSQVSRAAAAHGLYYAPDPSSGASCTVGGNIAENAGGIHCLKYGVTTDHVLAARVVLSDGSVVDLGAAGAGDSVGYDLLGVFVGSEGTFGIATEATVKLLPLPQSVRTLLADFSDIDEASRAVSAIIAAGLIPAALEMVDGATIRAVEASVFAAGLPLDAQAALLIELDGLEAGLDDEAQRAEGICKSNGARGVRHAADERERKKLWAARKGAFGAMGRLAPDMMLQDAVVPRSRLPEVLAETYRISAKYGLLLANVFHAGDGNLHPILCFDRRDADELRRVESANREIVETCVRAGGTLTGEHGVGLDKSKYMPLLFSEDDLDAMLSVRAAFDPTGLCNPGKIIPAPRGCGEARAVAASGGDTRNASGDNGRVESGITHAEAADEVESGAGKAPNFLSDEIAIVNPSAASIDKTRAASVDVTDAPLFNPQRAISGAVKDAFRQIAETEEDEGRGGALVVSPASTDEAAAVFRVAAREGLRVVLRGNGTLTANDQHHTRGSVHVSTRRLSHIVRHSPADLVVTVEAGVPLSVLNEELAGAGQWLPLDPPCGAGASVGGVVATNAAGAHAFAYGAPRAFVLGMTVVLPDGRAIKVGGRVVKNVAGYDLSKLFAGSFGTLGLITEINFKLRPRPEREATVRAHAESVGGSFDAARALLRGELLPVALDVRARGVATERAHADPASRFALLARFAGSAQTVESQLERASALLCEKVSPSHVEVVRDDARLWSEDVESNSGESRRTELKINSLPTRLPDALRRLEELLGDCAALERWDANVAAGRLRAGLGEVRDPGGCVDALARLRAELRAAGGSVVVETATRELRDAMDEIGFDQWGVGDARAALMRRVKLRLDPKGLLPQLFFA